jgi:hypothetical protein
MSMSVYRVSSVACLSHVVTSLSFVSVNIAIHFLISDLVDSAQAEAVETVINELFEQEDIAADVPIYQREIENTWILFGLSHNSIIMSRFWLWEPEFDQAFYSRIAAVAPEAKVALNMFDVDEERVEPRGAEAVRRLFFSWLPKGEEIYFQAGI